MTAAEKKQAARRAKRAGRRYPNLVDNMQVAKQKRERKAGARRRRRAG